VRVLREDGHPCGAGDGERGGEQHGAERAPGKTVMGHRDSFGRVKLEARQTDPCIGPPRQERPALKALNGPDDAGERG